ncbi:MAG TPA: hypothetical protein QGH10_11960, partial [Armatimonadota bacterium]|nr:hypothetical protein [Armatimonadota bacterium]
MSHFACVDGFLPRGALCCAVTVFALLPTIARTQSCTLYKAGDIENARENIKRHEWARQEVETWKRSVDYALQQDRQFFEEMIPDLTPRFALGLLILGRHHAAVGHLELRLLGAGRRGQHPAHHCQHHAELSLRHARP